MRCTTVTTVRPQSQHQHPLQHAARPTYDEQQAGRLGAENFRISWFDSKCHRESRPDYKAIKNKHS